MSRHNQHYLIIMNNNTRQITNSHSYYNPFPHHFHVGFGDFVRAMIKLTNLSFDVILDDLCFIAHKKKMMPDAPECIFEYLRQNGWHEHELYFHSDITIDKFLDTTKEYPNRKYLILTRLNYKHYFIACEDGVLFSDLHTTMRNKITKHSFHGCYWHD